MRNDSAFISLQGARRLSLASLILRSVGVHTGLVDGLGSSRYSQFCISTVGTAHGVAVWRTPAAHQSRVPTFLLYTNRFNQATS